MAKASYRSSHLSPDQGARYDELLYTPGRYDAEVWRIEQDLLEDLFARYFPQGIRNALDFACGTGRLTAFLIPRAGRVTGVDISDEMLRPARGKAPQAVFIRGDPIADRSLLKDREPFDCITCFRFLLNAEPELRAAALATLASLLEETGILICNNHGNRPSLLSLVLPVRKRLGMITQNSLPGREVRRLLDSRGWRVREIRGVCFLPRILSRWLPVWLWTGLERGLGRLRLLDGVAIYQVYVAEKRREPPAELS